MLYPKYLQNGVFAFCCFQKSLLLFLLLVLLSTNHIFFSCGTQTRALLPRLLPSRDFIDKRDRVRARLEKMLIKQLPQIPHGSTLRVFGSSANGFGSDEADLDM